MTLSVNRAALRRTFDDKVRAGIFESVAYVLAKVPAHLREDRVQEATARTWVAFERRGLRGEETTDALLLHIWKLHAGSVAEPPIAGCDGKHTALDAMNERNRHLVPAVCIDDLEDQPIHDPAGCVASFHVGAARPGRSDPTVRIIEAIDARTWFRLLSGRQRALVRDRARGLTYDRMAEKRNTSRDTVRREVDRLGRDLHTWLYEM